MPCNLTRRPSCCCCARRCFKEATLGEASIIRRTPTHVEQGVDGVKALDHEDAVQSWHEFKR
jgi:hypothetical protein